MPLALLFLKCVLNILTSETSLVSVGAVPKRGIDKEIAKSLADNDAPDMNSVP